MIKKIGETNFALRCNDRLSRKGTAFENRSSRERNCEKMLCVCRKCQSVNVQPVILTTARRYNAESSNNRGQRHVLTVGIDLPMYEVSTTRGVPSTSTDLKEALCEKIPIHYDLLRNFRQQYGSSVISQITVENMYQGLNGVNTMVRETSETDPKYGIKYRGLTIPEVITLLPREGKSPSAEAVFWLLLTGDIPTQEQTASLIADWSIRRQKRKDWWSGPGGGIVGSILQTLPKTTTPLGKLSVALTVFDSSKHMKEALRNRALSHTHWESVSSRILEMFMINCNHLGEIFNERCFRFKYTYEDSMELLATLPAIVGLVARNEQLENVKEEGDWVQFLLECLSNASNVSENHKKSMGDFLRLFVTLNADEDGGVPAVHVTEILGTTQLNINEALAAGALAYIDEPKSGTMSQCMEFQTKIQHFLGREPKEEKLKNYMVDLIRKNELIGYKETDVDDPRYTALVNYVREYLPDNSDLKLSQAITRILTSMMKAAKGKKIYPEQNTIAAPIFQFYGMKDMKFNQILLCMSRALGAIASIIWTRVVNAPVEHPSSKCTYTYLSSVRGVKRNHKLGKHVKHTRK